MEEKKRYVCKKIDGYNFFIDTETNKKYFINKYLVFLLNNQDKLIKGLEWLLNVDEKMAINSIKVIEKLKQENQQLNKKLLIIKKAFELACDPRDDCGGKEYSETEFNNYHDYFIAEAEQKLAEIGGEDE